MKKTILLFALVAIVFMAIPSVLAFEVKPQVVVIDHTYTFSIGPGGSFYTYSSLLDDIYGSTTGTGHADKYVMTVTDTCTITIELVDCCLMGDTICIGKSMTKKRCATSPDIVVVTHTFKPGKYVLGVWYDLPNTGVFPAGYDIWFTA